jgi:hypothetical protein
MVEVNGRLILWPFLKLYSHHGIHEVGICCGFKGYGEFGNPSPTSGIKPQ